MRLLLLLTLAFLLSNCSTTKTVVVETRAQADSKAALKTQKQLSTDPTWNKFMEDLRR